MIDPDKEFAGYLRESASFPTPQRVDEAVRQLSRRAADPWELPSPPVVCICGSTRHIEYHAIWMWELEKRGFICLGCHLLPRGFDFQTSHQAEAEGVAAQLDKLHRAKIDMAESVLFILPDGYIGSSTKGELKYCLQKSIPFIWTERPTEMP